jgi:hypothetical protein
VAALALAIAGVRAADLAPQERQRAKDLYEIKCAKCHKFYDPAQYSQKEWDVWMHKMSRKSKLKPAQEELLTRYLGEFRGDHRPPAPK